VSDIVRHLRAEGHHTEADAIELSEIVEALRAAGNHDLARTIDRNAGGGPIGEDGSIDVDALISGRARQVQDLGRAASLQANGHPADDERSVLDAITNTRPADAEPGPDAGRY
jgi:hypothetical protein